MTRTSLFNFSSHKKEPETAPPPNNASSSTPTSPVSAKAHKLMSKSASKIVPRKLLWQSARNSSSSHPPHHPDVSLSSSGGDHSNYGGSGSPVRVALSEDTLHGSETEIGIEISLDWDDEYDKQEEEKQEHRQDYDEDLPAVLHLGNQMRKRNKIHRSQFSVDIPVLERQEESSRQQQQQQQPLRRGHRVPLWESETDHATYKDVLALLKKHHVVDEIQAVNNEIGRLNHEIDALEQDQRDLDDRGKPGGGSSSRSSTKINLTKRTSTRQWDIHEWLALGDCDYISTEERRELEQRRGTCLTFHLHSRKARDAFMSTCGWDGGRTSYRIEHRKSGIVSLDPDNCKEGGAAEKVRHITIAGCAGGGGGRTGNHDTFFFVSRDRDKASTWGHLPPRLFQKMKGAGFDARHDLVYLSTGPRGCYYAEFRSGDCWWGTALRDDKDFQKIVQNWNVYRVAFGPIVTYTDDDGNKWTTNSWIVLARDGRAAWKNLPSRLHQKLESRLADWPAPAEVTLGSDDSYFIRFLDGSVDYCLPAEVANVCEYIESSGGQITDMALHSEVSQDFVIRHTMINQ